ncbi:hypothetical protein D9Q98_001732 [Chlorella vulgaris]|uniref:Uncharacterized protein n=1 Tax=Chlorella vulgaris TaxID=3077 RepID=A0A9D4YZM9_CHLVU|nr:hypothetical protein D9Q98_001732 [Chlorella vulgaris]
MAEAADTSVGIADADGVVAKLKGNGVLEKLRTQAIQRLEHDEGLRHSIEQAVRSSKTLASWSEKQPNRQLTSDLHSELGTELSREALRALWRVLSEPEAGLTQQIDDAIRAAMCERHAALLQHTGDHEPR